MDPPRVTDGNAASSATASDDISALACLSTFSAQHAAVWFPQAEASFRVSHITSKRPGLTISNSHYLLRSR